MNKIFSIFAGGAVALIILVDIATGQGPPALNYLTNGYRPQGPPPGGVVVPLQAINYPPRGDYDNKKSEKQFQDDKKKDDYAYEKDKQHSDKEHSASATPGMFSSLSSSMSDAWKSISGLGRSKRETTERKNTDQSTSRNLDNYEWKQLNSQGYIYFKIPKNLVCYN